MFAPINSPPFQPPSFNNQTPTPAKNTFLATQTPSQTQTNTNNNTSINTNTNTSERSRSKPFSCDSVALSCLSPDSASVHSVFPDGTIVTHFLPLHKTASDEHEHEERERGTETSSAYQYSETVGNGASRALTRNNNDNNDNKSIVKTVTTILPSHMIRSFHVDPPMEIICIDNEHPTSVSTTRRCVESLPLLCIYTKSAAFVLQIQYEHGREDEPSTSTSTSKHTGKVKGDLVGIHEPFEAHLTANSSSIIKIRPAPHSHMLNGNTYETLCNKGAMIMLTRAGTGVGVTSISTSTSNYTLDSGANSIVLFHGYHSQQAKSKFSYTHAHAHAHTHTSMSSLAATQIQTDVTIKATIDQEQTDMTPMVDFCFLPSSPSTRHSVWNAMTIVLATQSGSLYSLSPVVFHNTVFPRQQVEDAREMLQRLVLKYDHSVSKGAECRRGKAALQFLYDAFGPGGGDGHGHENRTSTSGGKYVKANMLDTANRQNATGWPVALQKVYSPEAGSRESDDIIDLVTCMQVVIPTSISTKISGSFCGIVLASGTSLEYVILPCGEHILPRFGFESGEDEELLDENLVGSSFLAEHVLLGEEEGRSSDRDHDHDHVHNQDGTNRIVLLPDPVDKTMIHRVSNKGVVTVTTNVVPLMEDRLMETANNRSPSNGGQAEEIKTNAWSSISIVKDLGKKLNGVIISSDVQFGHVLVAILSDKTTEAMNMTAAMYLNEAKNQLDAETPSAANVPEGLRQSSEVLKAMESLPPLSEQIKPHFEKISRGLSSMTKIVGGSTDPRKITPGSLATFLSMKQSSEQDIILPINELNSLVVSRQKYLQSMRDHQLEQLHQLQSTVKLLQDRMKATSAKMGIVKSNTDVLSNRSAGVLAAARDLCPSISDAEYLYFKDIDRFEANCGKWEGVLEDTREQYKLLHENSSLGPHTLSAEQRQLCRNLLEGQKEVLHRVNLEMKSMEQKSNTLVEACGLAEERKPLSAITDGRTNN